MEATVDSNTATNPLDVSHNNGWPIAEEHGVAQGIPAEIGSRVFDGDGHEGIVFALTDQLVLYRDSEGNEHAQRYGFCTSTLRPREEQDDAAPDNPATNTPKSVAINACTLRMRPGRRILVYMDPGGMTPALLRYATPDGVSASVDGEIVTFRWRDVDPLVTAGDFVIDNEQLEPQGTTSGLALTDLIRVGQIAHVEEEPGCGMWGDHRIVGVHETHVDFVHDDGETREAGWPSVKLYALEVLDAIRKFYLTADNVA